MSKLVKFSIGYIATDKTETSQYVRVIPVETTPQIDGIIADENNTIIFNGIDEDGEAISGNITTSNTIVAEWIGSDSQRMTAPDLRKGEVVMLYKYADEDRYFWESRNTKSRLRDTEHVVYLFAAKKKGDRKYLSLLNSYSLKVSSRDQQISVMMSTDNGEKSGYLFQLDGKDGKAILMDTKGQQISIESLINRITLINKQKSSIMIDKEDIVFNNLGNLTDTTAKTVSWTCKAFKADCDTFDVVANESFTVETADFKAIASGSATIDAPMTTVTGMAQTGPLTCASLSIAPPAGRAAKAALLKASAKGGAICKILGDVDVEGDITFKSGNLNMGGGNIIGAGVISGASASFSDSCTAPNIK